MAYTVHDYGLMLADARGDCYAEALRRVVRPGAVVVDLGSGTGIWAAYACQLGARRVYAIESGDVIGLAMDMAKANGLADRITFLQCDSADVSLDELADVVVADVRGILPLAGTSLKTMIDARRFVSPAGVIIPRRDTMWVSVVSAAAAHRAMVAPWDERCFGIDFSAARRIAVNSWRKDRFRAGDLISTPAAWADLDYSTLTNPSVGGRVQVAANRSATGHGLAIWFESELVEGVRMSNRPGDPPVLYGQGFFPWPRPVELAAGDTIDLNLRAVSAGTDYIFRWQTVVSEAGSGHARERFEQSTFEGTPLSLAGLQRQVDAVAGPVSHRAGPGRGANGE